MSSVPNILVNNPYSDRLSSTPMQEGQRVSRPWAEFFKQLSQPIGRIPYYPSDVHANRANYPPNSLPVGTVYYETDRQLFYVNVNSAWVYLAGVYSVSQQNLPTDLGTGDANVLVFVNDYAHLLQWNGSGWQWAPGEQGSGFDVHFQNPPNPATGWHACDGSQQTMLGPDGNVSLVTLPNNAGNYFRL